MPAVVVWWGGGQRNSSEWLLPGALRDEQVFARTAEAWRHKQPSLDWGAGSTSLGLGRVVKWNE